MNVFKSPPEKKIQRDLDAAAINRDKLAARLATAEASIADLAASAQRLARDGASDADLDTAEAALRASRDRRDTLSSALDEVNRQAVALESERDDLADKKLRRETADAIEKLGQELNEASAVFDTAAALLAEIAGRAAAIIYDAKGLEVFTVSVRGEVPVAVKMITSILHYRAEATIAGSAPAALPTEPAILEIPKPPETSAAPLEPDSAPKPKHRSIFQPVDRGPSYTIKRTATPS